MNMKIKFLLFAIITAVSIIGCELTQHYLSNDTNVNIKYDDPETIKLRKMIRERIKNDSIFEATAPPCVKIVKRTNIVKAQDDIKNCNGTINDLMTLIKINNEIISDTLKYANCKNIVNENALILNVANSNAYQSICGKQVVLDQHNNKNNKNNVGSSGGVLSSMHTARGNFGTANAFRSIGF